MASVCFIEYNEVFWFMTTNTSSGVTEATQISLPGPTAFSRTFMGAPGFMSSTGELYVHNGRQYYSPTSGLGPDLLPGASTPADYMNRNSQYAYNPTTGDSLILYWDDTNSTIHATRINGPNKTDFTVAWSASTLAVSALLAGYFGVPYPPAYAQFGVDNADSLPESFDAFPPGHQLVSSYVPGADRMTIRQFPGNTVVMQLGTAGQAWIDTTSWGTFNGTQSRVMLHGVTAPPPPVVWQDFRNSLERS